MLYGIALLLIVKYVVVGLKAWDGTLHPGRTEDPKSPFLQPLLGLAG